MKTDLKEIAKRRMMLAIAGIYEAASEVIAKQVLVKMQKSK